MRNARELLTTTVPALVLFASVSAAVSHAQAAEGHGHVVVSADEVEWKPGPPILSGVEMAVLSGNPTEDGPFIMRLKFPAFFDYQVHRHPGTEGHVTVLSGAIGMALGETFDRYAAPPLPAGSYFVMPDEWHFAWTYEETIVQVHGDGPWRVEFLDR